MIFISQEGDIINTTPDDAYFKRVREFIEFWQSGVEYIEVNTSGSTGYPKSIRLSRAQIKASVGQTAEAFMLSSDSLFLCILGLDFIAGKLMIIRALELNAELLVLRPEGNLFEQIGRFVYLLEARRQKIFMAFVPLQLNNLLAEPEGQSLLNLAQVILIGGAPISQHLEYRLQEIRPPVFATFGMTETVTHFAIRPVNGENRSQRFKSLPGTSIKLSEEGTLMVKNASTTDQWISTNDLVEMTEDGSFVPKGRIDQVINSGGVKLNLHLIEQKIDELIELNQAFFCFGLPDEKLGQKLVLFVENTADKSPAFEKLKAKLPKFECPREIRFVEHFFRTTTGKIDKLKTANAFTIPNE